MSLLTTYNHTANISDPKLSLLAGTCLVLSIIKGMKNAKLEEKTEKAQHVHRGMKTKGKSDARNADMIPECTKTKQQAVGSAAMLVAL